MKNAILHTDIYRCLEIPSDIKRTFKESLEKEPLRLVDINKKRIMQLLKRKLSNSIPNAKRTTIDNEYNCISRLRNSTQIYKKKTEGGIYVASPSWKNNIIIKKTNNQSKMEVVFHKGSIYKGRASIIPMYQRKGSNRIEVKQQKCYSLSNNKSATLFEETLNNSDKSRNENSEYDSNFIMDSINFKCRLPKIMPRRKFNVVTFKKKLSRPSALELTTINSGWNLGAETEEFSNEMLAIE
jgi:hypothetical protein